MRICEIIANKKYKRILKTIAEKQGAIDFWCSSELEDGRQIYTMVVTVSAMPIINDLSEDIASFFDPIVAAKDSARLGAKSGAITIAPTTTAILSSDKPIVATIDERITIKT